MSLPRILQGRRTRLFLGLILNGLTQAGFALAGVIAFDRLAASFFRDLVALAAAATCAAVVFALRILQRRHGETFALSYIGEARGLLMSKLLDAPSDARIRLGLVTTRLGSDLLALKSWLAEGFAGSIAMGVSLAVLLAGAAAFYPGPAIALGAIVVLWGIVLLLVRRPLTRSIADARRLRGRLSAEAGDQIAARLTLAHFGRRSSELIRLQKRSDMLAGALVRRATWSELLRATPEWALPVAALSGVLMAGQSHGPAPLILLAALASSYLSRLSRAFDLHASSAQAIDRLSVLLKAPGLADVGGEAGIARGEPVLLDISSGDRRMQVAPGSLAVLSGGEAADRSQFLQSVARLRGGPLPDMSVNGRSLGAISIRDCRRVFTYVGPLLPLIRASVRENIMLGAPSSMTNDEAFEVARRLCVAKHAEEMDTMVESHAVPPALAFRLRLARALARRASVILFDDAVPTGESATLAAALEMARAGGVTVISAVALAEGQETTILPIGSPLRPSDNESEEMPELEDQAL